MFTVDTIHNFLLEKKLITLNSIINGDYETTTIDRRNRNLQVTTLFEGNYIIKQVFDKKAENSKTLANEIEFYNILHDSYPEISAFCPEMKYSDKKNRILILNFYRNTLQLWKYYNKKNADNLPLETIAAIAKILSRLHCVFSTREISKDSRLSFLSRDLPFIFKIFKPDTEILNYIRAGGIEFLENIQSDDLMMNTLESVTKMWKPDSLIHGDVKLDNFLVMEDSEDDSTASENIKVIDWELVQFGDSAWDVAGVFNDFIFWWAISMPDLKTPEEMVRNAAFPITKLKPGTKKFWETYCESSALSEQAQTVLLEKVVRFAGLRVLQTAYEICSKFNEIPSIGSVLLGIGKSILRKPDEAAELLFGISKKEPVI